MISSSDIGFFKSLFTSLFLAMFVEFEDVNGFCCASLNFCFSCCSCSCFASNSFIISSKLNLLRKFVKNWLTCDSVLVPINSAIDWKSLPYLRMPRIANWYSSLLHRELIRLVAIALGSSAAFALFEFFAFKLLVTCLLFWIYEDEACILKKKLKNWFIQIPQWKKETIRFRAGATIKFYWSKFSLCWCTTKMSILF